MMQRRSIRFRLTAWYAAILSIGLGLFGCLVWFELRNRLISEVDEDLAGSAGRFESYFRTESAEASGNQLRDELEEFSQALPPGSYVQIRGQNGFTFRHPREASAPASHFRVLRRTFEMNGIPFDLEVGQRIAAVAHTLDLLRWLLLSLIPVVIAIACIGGAWLSGRALKPVHDLTSAALNISIENLSARLPVPGTGDEIARLTEVLNSMLSRLENAVRMLSQFAADASHELRTPLAVIRTGAELALRRSRTPESYQASLREIVAETTRMTCLVEDLLTLARTDTAAADMPMTRVSLQEIIEEVYAEMHSLAELRGIQIRTAVAEESPAISGNRAALHRLLLALVDNAIKFSSTGGEVILSLEESGDRVALAVEDFGCGIRDADLPHIFKRYYRADDSRTTGHGLGLALAQSIARAHGASIDVRSSPDAGSKFRVSFPLRDAKLAALGSISSAV